MPAGFRKVYQYDLNGNFVKEYDNINAASFLFGKEVYFSVVNKHVHSGGYIWSYDYYIKYPNDSLEKIKNSKTIKTKKYKNNKIYKYDLYGNFVTEYNNINDVSKDNLVKNNILRVLEGRYKISYDHIWKNEYFEKLPDNILKKHLRKNSSKVYQYTKDGKFLKEFNSVGIASKELKIKVGSISNALNGIRNKVLKNFIFRTDYYKSLPKNILEKHVDSRHRKILQYDLNGNFIKEWDCCSDIQKKFKVGSNLSSVLTGKRNHTCGYIWKYKDIV